MHLFEAIIDANHRAVAGDASAGLRPAEFADALPVVALTCMDPRLNAFFPNALALPADQFIWLRNAGNIITSPLSSTMRSLALACAIKGGREIAIIGHTDCQVCHTTTMALLDKLKALGVERHLLPENVSEFFGTFATERANVIKACAFARCSPLIGPKIPVHGLMLDVETGKLDWVVNGYDVWSAPVAAVKNIFSNLADAATKELGSGPMAGFNFGEMKFPELKIGDSALPGKPIEVKVTAVEAPVPSSSVPPPLKKSPLPPIKMTTHITPRKDLRRG